VVRLRSSFLIAIAVLVCLGSGSTQTPKFYADDPVQADPKPVPVINIERIDVYAPYDYFYQAVRQNSPAATSGSRGINTMGEVPDNAWFTNRHGRVRMTQDALKRGAGNENAPQPPFIIVGAKTQGITPGFRMRDAKGRLYFVKVDPISNPELSTGAEVIGAKFFHAIGYNTPENYIVRIHRSDCNIDIKTKITGPDRFRRKMVAEDLQDILQKAPLQPDGSIRAAASLSIPGKDLGPFRYEGTRSDDPNDLIPHEDRRDLRSLFVFCAWLNHTDAKAANSINALVEADAVPYVRHYLIDFGSTFGSDGNAAKDARFGNEYQIPAVGRIFGSLFSLGLFSPGWERAVYPRLKAAGHMEWKNFDPERWKSNYPNPAFLRRQPDDEYWAAKIVLSFTDQDIRTLVETGEYSDPRVVDYLVAALSQRRDKIARTYFSKVLPLDHFRVSNDELLFDDLAVHYGFRPALQYGVSWSKFDNGSRNFTPLPEETSFRLPRSFPLSADEEFFAASIHALTDERKTVKVFLRKSSSSAEIVGLQREWK
jgi:hypothetical protein